MGGVWEAEGRGGVNEEKWVSGFVEEEGFRRPADECVRERMCGKSFRRDGELLEQWEKKTRIIIIVLDETKRFVG
jgi:hypothetical protein